MSNIRSRSPATIIIGIQTDQDTLVLYVRDNDVGLAMQYVNKIFMPFQRLHSDKYEGTGIGLSTVQRVVQRHGGDIWVESAPGKGTAFYFILTAKNS